MLNSKACAVALLDDLKKSKILKIENQYTKDDVLFYKFKDSNIAVSKRLNNMDFSILSKEDWDYLLITVNNDYISKNDYIDSKAYEYSSMIHEWSENDSLISKMFKLMNNDIINNAAISNSVQTLERNEKILNLLLNNRAVLVTNDRTLESIELDVSLVRVFNREDLFNKIKIVMQATDHNISIVRNMVERTITNPNEEQDIIQVNRINALIGLLISKYNLNNTDENFIKHRDVVFTISSRWNDYNSRNLARDSFKSTMRNALLGVLSGGSNLLSSVLRGQGYYHGIWDVRSEINNNIVNLRIDYASMTDEYLTLFKNSVVWLIDRHAKYVNVRAKERESFLMYLGSNELEGKKKTKEVLTSHLSLRDMYAEIERRGL